MNVTIRKIGNSEGVILPKEVLERQGLKSGDQLVLSWKLPIRSWINTRSRCGNSPNELESVLARAENKAAYEGLTSMIWQLHMSAAFFRDHTVPLET